VASRWSTEDEARRYPPFSLSWPLVRCMGIEQMVLRLLAWPLHWSGDDESAMWDRRSAVFLCNSLCGFPT
jgi:hypothetical protein